MKSATLQSFAIAVLVAVIASVIAGIITRMIMKKKQNPDGTQTAKLLGLVEVDGVMAFDGDND